MKAPDEKPATEICAGSTGRFFRDSAAYAGAQESANRSAATLAKRDMTNAPGASPPPRHIRPMLARCKCAERLEFLPLGPIAIRLQACFLHCDVSADYFPLNLIHWFS